MATTPVVTVRLEPELRERLDRLAKSQRRSRSFVATEAIREYVNRVPRRSCWGSDEVRVFCAPQRLSPSAFPSFRIASNPRARIGGQGDAVDR